MHLARPRRAELTTAIHCDVLYDFFFRNLNILKKTFSDDIQITYQLLNTVTDHLPERVFRCVCACVSVCMTARERDRERVEEL